MSKLKSRSKESLLILGASGGVAHAFLQLLTPHRHHLDKLVLLDRCDSVLHSPHLDHTALKYVYVREIITEINALPILKQMVKDFGITMVLDMTDCDSLPILAGADKLGINYLNCSINADHVTIRTFTDISRYSREFNNGTHLLSLGMNPGIMNHMIIHGISAHGIPQEIVQIEFDSGQPKHTSANPFITWSRRQFLEEAVSEPSGYCKNEGVFHQSSHPPIHAPVETEQYLAAIKKMDSYPLGIVVPHEEIIFMAHRFKVPSRFIYAIHPNSFEKLKELYDKNGTVKENELDYIENNSCPLNGSDLIGVWLRYPDKSICQYCEMENEKIRGANATQYMVAIGVIVGLREFITNPIRQHGVYHVHDLHNGRFMDWVAKYLAILTIEVPSSRQV